MTIVRRLQKKFFLWRVRNHYAFLRANGFVLMDRTQWLEAQAHLYNIEMRCRRLQGGGASKMSLRARNKKLRRLAQRFRSYLEQLDDGGEHHV
jgi:hypothetical protein